MAPSEVRQKSFSDQRVELDNKHFVQCRFARCVLVFGATGTLSLEQNEFTDCKWELTGAAATTIQFLRALYHGAGPEGAKLVDDTFDEIRRST